MRRLSAIVACTDGDCSHTWLAVKVVYALMNSTVNAEPANQVGSVPNRHSVPNIPELSVVRESLWRTPIVIEGAEGAEGAGALSGRCPVDSWL